MNPLVGIINARYDAKKLIYLRRIAGMRGDQLTDVLRKALDEYFESHKDELPAQVRAEIESKAM